MNDPDSIRIRMQPTPQLFRCCNRGRKPDYPQIRIKPPQSRQQQGQHIATFTASQRMQFIQNNRIQCFKHMIRVIPCQHQLQRFRCGHKDIRRLLALALPVGGAGITGARFGA